MSNLFKKAFHINKNINKKINKTFKGFFEETYLDAYRNNLNEYISNCHKIIHLGSGKSSLSKYCSMNLNHKNIYSLDINYDVLILNPDTYKIVADASEIPFLSNSADLIATEHTFEHFINPEQVLKEIYRILKPGGYLVSTFPNSWYYASVISHLTPYWFHVFYLKLLHGASDEIIKQEKFPTYYKFNSYNKIKKLSKKLGFKITAFKTYIGLPSYTSALPFPLHFLAVIYHILIQKMGKVKVFLGATHFLVLEKTNG
jgi:ubiquinone/menaquinone biosynthesis C-methylase UbiE